MLERLGFDREQADQPPTMMVGQQEVHSGESTGDGTLICKEYPEVTKDNEETTVSNLKSVERELVP